MGLRGRDSCRVSIVVVAVWGSFRRGVSSGIRGGVLLLNRRDVDDRGSFYVLF